MSTLMKNKSEKLKKENTDKQKGFSIIELMGYLALTGILGAGVFVAINNGVGSSKEKTLGDDIVALGTSVIGTSNANGTYGNGTSLVEYIIRAGKVPGSLTVTGTAPNRVLNHPFGGTVDVTGRINKLVVTLNDIPGEVCMDRFTGASAWERVIVSDTAPTSISVTSGGYTPPYTYADATAACSETNLNKMHFIR